MTEALGDEYYLEVSCSTDPKLPTLSTQSQSHTPSTAGCNAGTGTEPEKQGSSYYLAECCSTDLTLQKLSQSCRPSTAAHHSLDSDILDDCKHSMLRPINSTTFMNSQKLPGTDNDTFNLVHRNHQLVATLGDEMNTRSEKK